MLQGRKRGSKNFMYETMGDWVWILYRRVQENGLPRPPGRMPVRVFRFRGQMFMHEIFTLWRPLILEKLVIINSRRNRSTECTLFDTYVPFLNCLISYNFIFYNNLYKIREFHLMRMHLAGDPSEPINLKGKQWTEEYIPAGTPSSFKPSKNHLLNHIISN